MCARGIFLSLYIRYFIIIHFMYSKYSRRSHNAFPVFYEKLQKKSSHVPRRKNLSTISKIENQNKTMKRSLLCCSNSI